MSHSTKILYIEDDKGSQRLVQRVLENHGYTVTLADDGFSGIRLAREEPPSLILMDINLPGLNGREITTRLRALGNFQDVPIIALTANASPNSRERALAAGCDGFLTKPIDILTFPKEVSEYLSGRREELNDRERLQHLEKHAQQLVSHLEDKIQELQAANQRLRELDRAKSNFIALVSHELRTPLTLIEGYAHLLDDHVRQTPQEAYPAALHELVNGMSMGVERIGRVISEIVSVSRIASGTMELAYGPVHLRQLVEMIVRDRLKAIGQRPLTITVSGLEDLPAIEADGIQLRIAINNVVENAVKFTPDGGQITITGREVDNIYLDLVVQDTGIGIPLEEQRRIFDQFHILGSIEHHSTSKSAFRGGGLGLGLPIARGIIEAHNGRIWVESSPEKAPQASGSTFHILLPIHQAP
ncbi:MAG: hybrid sensor histidine kinase/response regulator [Ardenticatenaceae bacterium]|nr:hybrid sensor histidine kinase/response regulator [Anaerolineales bacterium]MCB8916345.1 hybrid sensor histidine kinase/response regulator [Ardenticatenaceae bacterium]